MARRVVDHWVGLLIGTWLLISPWVLSFDMNFFEKWSSVLCGLVLVLVNSWVVVGAYDEKGDLRVQPNNKNK